jgi:hypothetical protein
LKFELSSNWIKWSVSCAEIIRKQSKKPSEVPTRTHSRNR